MSGGKVWRCTDLVARVGVEEVGDAAKGLRSANVA